MNNRSVQFSRSVVSNSLQPHESQQARPPCPSTTPVVYSNSYPLGQKVQKHWVQSINFSALSFLYSPTLTSIHDYWKNHTLTRWTFVDKVMSLLFNVLSRLVITFHRRSERLLISWVQSPSAVILEPPKIKSDTVSTVFPSIAMKWRDQKPWS